MTAIPTEERTVDRKARMKLEFVDLRARPSDVRLKDFEATFYPLTEDEARQAAERCIQCPEAPCMAACPVHNDIPGAMWLIENGDFVAAAELYRQTSSLPEICGLVCPHEALCQGSCGRAKRGEPGLTRALEAFTTAFQRDHGDVKIPRGEPSGKRVAVIGAGPAGLACAEQLITRGHAVTYFEASPAP